MSIRLEHISLNLGGQQILEDFSLELPSQGLVCLCGPSGCGKTSLLLLLAGLLQPQKGIILGLEGQRIAMVFQEDRLLPWVNAAQNVELVLPGPHRSGQALPWLDLVELAPAAHKLPAQLSGGMRRRVAIARALAHQGQLLLLDEPTNGLDAELAARLLQRIKEQYAAKLIIMVTHDRAFGASYGDMVLELSGPPLRIQNTISPS